MLLINKVVFPVRRTQVMKIAIGIDIGGTNTKTVLASEEGEVLLSHNNPTPHVTGKSKEKLESLLVKNLKDFLK